MAQLEELRMHGQKIRASILRVRLVEGNTLCARARQEHGQEAEEALQLARESWYSIMMLGGTEAVTAQCNVAALALQKKE